MDFQVVLARQAEQELNAAADWIAEQSQSPAVAEKWFAEFVQTLQSLQRMPTRCGLARENNRFPVELRQLLYGRRNTYRAVFTIRENQVIVLTIRHTARADFSPDDLQS